MKIKFLIALLVFSIGIHSCSSIGSSDSLDFKGISIPTCDSVFWSEKTIAFWKNGKKSIFHYEVGAASFDFTYDWTDLVVVDSIPPNSYVLRDGRIYIGAYSDLGFREPLNIDYYNTSTWFVKHVYPRRGLDYGYAGLMLEKTNSKSESNSENVRVSLISAKNPTKDQKEILEAIIKLNLKEEI